MKIIINASSTPLSIDKTEEYNNVIIISSFKGATKLGAKKWLSIPYSNTVVERLNFAFWIINFARDHKWEFFSRIEEIKIITPCLTSKNNKSIIRLKKSKIKKIRTPLINHYFKDKCLKFTDDEALYLWKNSKLKNDSLLKNFYFKRKYNFIYGEQKIDNLLAFGNEGYITKIDNKLIKTSIPFKDINKQEPRLLELYGGNYSLAYKKIPGYYNFEVEVITNEKLRFQYPNLFYPTRKIGFHEIANSLMRQKKYKIFIDDYKISNYSKYLVDNKIWKTEFADLGKSFVEFHNDKDFNRNFDGAIRDSYHLVKYQNYDSVRNKIRDLRVFSVDELRQNKDFKKFHDFVKNGYACIRKMREACNLNYLPKFGKWVFCLNQEDTMFKKWSKDKKYYIDLSNIDKDHIVKCNCKKLRDLIDKKTPSKVINVLNAKLCLTPNLVEYDFGIRIIALLTTSGDRDISKAITSIEKQETKVDQIIIASEEEIKSKYLTYINPYKKGLARNTTQALSKIAITQGTEVFVATIDDDDEWKPEYIKEVRKEISKGNNFICTNVEVLKNGKKIEEYNFKTSDLRIDTFLYGNCGLQGSNKVFRLDLAMESGGMPKNINASTDRAFNINLLSHPNVKPIAITKLNVIYNQDSNRNRISNDKKRLGELRKFYRTFWHLIDKKRIGEINERHKKLHDFEEVINWK